MVMYSFCFAAEKAICLIAEAGCVMLSDADARFDRHTDPQSFVTRHAGGSYYANLPQRWI
jgi:hypothetical protein